MRLGFSKPQETSDCCRATSQRELVDSARLAGLSSTASLRPFFLVEKVEAVEVGHLCPGIDKVLHELLADISACVHLSE